MRNRSSMLRPGGCRGEDKWRKTHVPGWCKVSSFHRSEIKEIYMFRRDVLASEVPTPLQRACGIILAPSVRAFCMPLSWRDSLPMSCSKEGVWSKLSNEEIRLAGPRMGHTWATHWPHIGHTLARQWPHSGHCKLSSISR